MDDHQEGPDIFPEDLRDLRDTEWASAPCTDLRQSKCDQDHLIVQHFRFMPLET
ncbi:MAG: hypothetical protein K5661_03725 [Bacteroidales bacterium]|nr:hypothetical protein [Bacteroidales bacterium]